MGLAAVLLAAAMVRYRLSFSELSSEPKYWDAFGSYVAGVSALVVGFATIVLLLRNVDLLKDQVETQGRLIDAQRKELESQARRERSANVERAIGRVLAAIRGHDAACKAAWSTFITDVKRVATLKDPYADVSAGDHDIAFARCWTQLERHGELLRVRSLLAEVHQRCVEAESEGVACEDWAAWIAGELPDSALQILYYETRQSPDGRIAHWVRNQGLMRYASKSMLLREDHALPDLPLPCPVQERQGRGAQVSE